MSKRSAVAPILALSLLLLACLFISTDQASAQLAANAARSTDLADIPLNRPDPQTLARERAEQFFPALLGLRRPGAEKISTRYFNIYYTTAEHTARRIAEMADEVFEEVSAYYPTSRERYKRMHVVVDDGVDIYGNAYASYNSNYIHFWATPFDLGMRGTNDWIRDTFTHELTHIITLKAAHHAWPFYFGIASASRSDENPDFNFTLPLYHLTAPSWFVEGIAQYESMKYEGDSWDTHREMMLRMAVLEDDLLSYENMGVFGKDGHHSEMIYNHGFALLKYVGETYGDDKVRALVETRPILNFKSTIKQVVGVSANQLYRDWHAHLQERHGRLLDSVRTSGEHEGDLLYDGGSLDYNPVYSPDGGRVAFLSNGDSDYALTRLMVMDLETRKVTKVAQYVDRRFSWSPDGSEIYYVKSVGGRWDIYAHDLVRKKSHRVTIGLRGKDPAVSPDGKQIAFVGNRDGSQRLGIVNINGTNTRYLTQHNDGTQYYGPQWSPDGSRILFTVFRGEDRDIAVIDAEATPFPKKTSTKPAEDPDSTKAFPDSLAYANDAGFEALLRSTADERDPVWLPDGSGFLYSSDRTGVFNLYTFDLATGRQSRVTNVIGGAFGPSITADGQDIVYAGFHAANYSLYRISRGGEVSVAAADTVDRDYRTIYSGDELSEVFDVGRYSSVLSSQGIVPVLVLGPTFIGNRFGLDQLSFGLQGAWGDLLGNDTFVTGFTLGKNLKKGVDLNSDVYFYYQNSLSPILTEQKTYSPSLFVTGSRQTINSLIDRGVVASRRDTVPDANGLGTLQVVIDSQLVLIPNVQQHNNLSLTETDKYKNLFSDFTVGTQIGLGRRAGLSLAYSFRRYRESLHVEQVILDSTRIVQFDPQTGVGTDITDEVPGTGGVQEAFNEFLYQDLDFFRSNDFLANLSYISFKPTKDSYVNPTGGRAFTLRYRRINATVTDSLALSADFDDNGIPDPSVSDISPTIYREDKAKLGINEYILSWNEFIPFPGRSTLAIQAFLGYKDKPIKKPQQNGGTNEGVFYYPLRYYLGGLGTLRGYPYFSMSGGKIFFSRASFTFPIVKSAAKELPPFFFDKIYGTVFIETGATANFESLKSRWDAGNRFNRDAFLTDWGFELRMQLFSNYRIPMFGYFQIAFPTRDRIRDRNDPTIIREIDSRRIYFGITI